LEKRPAPWPHLPMPATGRFGDGSCETAFHWRYGTDLTGSIRWTGGGCLTRGGAIRTRKATIGNPNGCTCCCSSKRNKTGLRDVDPSAGAGDT
jgi:hypothetical protein